MKRMGSSLALDRCFRVAVGLAGVWLLWSNYSGPRVGAASRGGIQERGRVPVLVELFTSEGCSSCPPADALLARLDREQPVAGAEIVVLGEHVDYWDSLGWKDRFSSPEFTERQKEYGGRFGLGDVYTPQMVINGSVQLNGADGPGARRAIEQAAAGEAVRLELAGVEVHQDKITFTVKDGGPASPGNVNVYAALVDPAASTEVRAGENRGRTLRHAGVVRTLGRVGSSWRTNALGKSPFVLQANLPGTPGSLEGMRLVVFVQAKPMGAVLGAVSCTLGGAGGQAARGAAQTPLPGNACPGA